MKPPVSKSLIFSFFLIGIIAGMVMIEFGYLPAPSLAFLSHAPSAADGDTAPRLAAGPEANVRKRTEKARKAAQGSAAKPTPPAPVVEPIDCDRDEAMAVRERARKIALIAEQDEQLSVTLNRDWAYYSSGIRRSFIERFAASDTCLQGRARTIHFYFRGERVATADNRGGIALY